MTTADAAPPGAVSGPGARRGAPLRWIVGALILLVLPPTASAAQGQELLPVSDAPGWTGEGRLLAVNAALGAVTTVVARAIRGEPGPDVLWKGALGGAISYAGKRLAVAEFDGAGFLGREVVAVGASIVHNTAWGEPTLSTLALPIGPLRLHVRTPHGAPTGWSVRPRVDAHDLGWMLYGALHPRLSLDASESLSSGIPAFRVVEGRLRQGGSELNGLALGGVMFLDRHRGGASSRDRFQRVTLRHEVVHVLQMDFLTTAWGRPLGRGMVGMVPGSAPVLEWVDPGFAVPAVAAGAVTLFGRGGFLFLEAEAEYLQHR